MKKRICTALILGLAVLVAGEGVAEAQSAGEASKVEPPTALLPNARVTALIKTSKELKTMVVNLSERKNDLLTEFRKKSISDISFEEVSRMLHVQKVELAIELEGLKARSDFLKEKIGSLDPGADGSVKLQVDAAKMQMKLAQQRLETTSRLFKKGARSEADVLAAEQEVAVAKLRVKVSSEKLNSPSPEIVKAMFEVSLEIAEKTAKQSTVEKMLKNYIESRGDFNDLRAVNEKLDDSLDWIRQLNRELLTPELLDAKF